MFPESLSTQCRHRYPRRKAQRGSMLVIAIFILTVIMLFGAAMQSIYSTAGQSIAYEVYGIRALNAANSGAERAMQWIFYPVAVDGGPLACSTTDIAGGPELTLLTLENQSAFHGCTVAVQCFTFDFTIGTSKTTHHRVESTATCIAGDFTTVRTVAIEGRVKETVGGGGGRG